MSLENDLRTDGSDPETERLERLLAATTPKVEPPPLGLLERIRDRRRRRHKMASAVGAVALIVGSIAIGGLAAQVDRDSNYLNGDASLTAVDRTAPSTEAQLQRWLAAVPASTDTSPMYQRVPLPTPVEVKEFVVCEWVESWRSSLASGDASAVGLALDALELSKGWTISQAVPTAAGAPDVADLAGLAKGIDTTELASSTPLWQLCQ